VELFIGLIMILMDAIKRVGCEKTEKHINNQNLGTGGV
jgi:hypothetical protein